MTLKRNSWIVQISGVQTLMIYRQFVLILLFCLFYTSSIASPQLHSITLVDFGITEESNHFQLEGWDNVLKDRYTDYSSAGPGGTTIVVSHPTLGPNGSYDYQGVSGTYTDFRENDQIVVTWYNDTDMEITFAPRISFDDPDRSVSGESGTWYTMNEITVPPYDTAQSAFQFHGETEGTYLLVNVSVGESVVLICDKIEWVSNNPFVDPIDPDPEEPPVDPSTPVTTVLVDFGMTEENNTFELKGWDNVFKDRYTGYSSAGPGGTTIVVSHPTLGPNGSYDYQGVSGTYTDFRENDRIVVTWYNDTDTEITFAPRISFDDPDRSVSGESGIWYTMNEITVPPYDTAQSTFQFDEWSEETYTLVNVSVDEPVVLICDKIEWVSVSGSVTPVDPDPEEPPVDPESYPDVVLLDYNEPGSGGKYWHGWKWYDDVCYGKRGWIKIKDDVAADADYDNRYDIHNIYWNGWGPRSFEENNNNYGFGGDPTRIFSVDAEIDTTDRAPGSHSGNSLKVFDSGSQEMHRAYWWLWYDGPTLGQTGVANENTDRWEFYIKTAGIPQMDPKNVPNYNYALMNHLSWGKSWPKEGPGNQHYYHYLSINPGAWIKVQLDRFPQHRRGSFVKGNNPTFNYPDPDQEGGPRHYLPNMNIFYIATTEWNDGGPLTSFNIDEIRFYSSKTSVEPDQNEESITSLCVGYWPEEDHWEISWHDMSWTDDGAHRNKPKAATFDVRWSTEPITNDNFEMANSIDPMFHGGIEAAGEPHLVRHTADKSITWTRFKIDDEVESQYARIYFAVKDVSQKGMHKGSVFPYNSVYKGEEMGQDGHDSPSPYIRTIEYDLN